MKKEGKMNNWRKKPNIMHDKHDKNEHSEYGWPTVTLIDPPRSPRSRIWQDRVYVRDNLTRVITRLH